MKNALIFVCTLLVPGCATHPFRAEMSFPEGTGTVLSGEDSIRLARPCSGRSPGRIEGQWKPTAEQIYELESRLPSVFEAHRREDWPELRDRATDYYRQYAGFVINGQRVIYVQGIIKDEVEGHPIIDRRRPSLTWRDLPIRICDGGAMTFDTIYNPDSRSFVGFAFGDTLPLAYPAHRP